MSRAAEQHDHHCVMNVGYRPWRIQWIRGGRHMMVAGDGQTKVADLHAMNWDKYCREAAAWLKDECARLAAREEADKAERERREARLLREAHELASQMIAHERLLASGYGSIDDLEDEAVLIDLEFVDVKPILAVDCQTIHLERLVV